MNTATETAQNVATLADARAMAGDRHYVTAWCLLRSAEGLEAHGTMDTVDPETLSAEGRELFDLLDAVDIDTMCAVNGDVMQYALHHYADDNVELAYEALDRCLPALAMVQRWDMTYCEYMEWLDSVCQG